MKPRARHSTRLPASLLSLSIVAGCAGEPPGSSDGGLSTTGSDPTSGPEPTATTGFTEDDGGSTTDGPFGSTTSPAQSTTGSSGSSTHGESVGSSTGMEIDPSSGSDDGGSSSSSSSDGSDGLDPEDCVALEIACATISSDELVLFRLSDGMLFDFLPIPPEAADTRHSIAWLDQSVYVCTGEPVTTLHRVELLSGDVTSSDLECNGVTSAGRQLLVRRGSNSNIFEVDYAYYDDFDAAVANLPTRVANYEPDLHRIHATDDALFSSWFSSDEVEVYDLETGAYERTIPLEGYGSWIWGLEVIEDLLVIDTVGLHPHRHIAFDLETGTRLCEEPNAQVELDWTEGLACVHASF